MLRIMMLLANARNDVMFAHYAVRRNIIHAVNITAAGNIICPQGQTSFSVNAPLRASRYCASVFIFVAIPKKMKSSNYLESFCAAICKRRRLSSLPSTSMISVAPPGVTAIPATAIRMHHMTAPDLHPISSEIFRRVL